MVGTGTSDEVAFPPPLVVSGEGGAGEGEGEDGDEDEEVDGESTGGFAPLVCFTFTIGIVDSAEDPR